MKITVTRALAELKLLDSRILKEIKQASFLDLSREREKGKALQSGKTIDEFMKNAQASWDAIQELLKRRDSMKSAIVISNVNTKLKIGNVEMTVAEAIDRKNTISYRQSLHTQLTRQYSSLMSQVESHSANLDQQVTKMLEANLGKDVKASTDDYKFIAKPFIEANEVKMVDPLKVDEKIKALGTEIEEFLKDVDFALSESNARTEIEVA